MEKTWYKRLLLSYIPVIFVTISILLFIFVSVVSEITIKETEKANGIFVEYVMDSMQKSLQSIEGVMLEEIAKSDALYSFFEINSVSSDRQLVNFQASKEMSKMIGENPMIDSIYLYRASDQTVLTSSAIVPLDQFPDQSFVRQSVGQPTNTGWTSVRLYQSEELDSLGTKKKVKVISISKKALLPFGGQGIVVVNVKVDSLLQIVNQMINRNITFLTIRSGDGQQVYPEPGVPLTAGQSEVNHQGKVTSQAHSDYLQWDFESGIKGGQFFSWIPIISHLWVGIGIVTILICIAYLFYVTRRNYKPIETIMEQINSIQSRAAEKATGKDEFAFIGHVLDNLIDQTNDYEKRYQEDLIIRRKQFFQELIEGKAALSKEGFQAQMDRFRMPGSFSRLLVSVAEIDGYTAFQQQYSQQDQQLLKFALTNVLQEFFGSGNQRVWAEWIAGKRLTILLMSEGAAEEQGGQVAELMDKFRIWVAVNLKFSITIGLGSAVDEVGNVHRSFEQAIQALRYKMSLGNNQIISYEELQDESASDTNKYFQLMDSLVQEFRMTSPSWELRLDQFAHYMEQDLLLDQDIQHLFHYVLSLFQRTMEEFPPETRDAWNETVKPQLVKALAEAETLEDILPLFVRLLKQLHDKYAVLRESKNHHHLMNEIRAYIEQNFANPDLSLNHISDKFGVKPSTLSL